MEITNLLQCSYQPPPPPPPKPGCLFCVHSNEIFKMHIFSRSLENCIPLSDTGCLTCIYVCMHAHLCVCVCQPLV